jgi:hypothetical protein
MAGLESCHGLIKLTKIKQNGAIFQMVLNASIIGTVANLHGACLFLSDI